MLFKLCGISSKYIRTEHFPLNHSIFDFISLLFYVTRTFIEDKKEIQWNRIVIPVRFEWPNFWSTPNPAQYSIVHKIRNKGRGNRLLFRIHLCLFNFQDEFNLSKLNYNWKEVERFFLRTREGGKDWMKYRIIYLYGSTLYCYIFAMFCQDVEEHYHPWLEHEDIFHFRILLHYIIFLHTLYYVCLPRINSDEN
jgi:hypothetical protein